MSNANKVIPFDVRNPSSYAEENSMDVDSLKITATLFKSAYDNGKKEVETTWGELYEFLLNAPRYPTKKDCHGLKLASFGERIEKKALRNNENVQQVFGVEIDYDAGEVTTTQAQEIFERAGLAAIIYTTYGHKPEEGIHKWRALLPLSKPIKGAERLEWWERVNNLVDGKLDPMLATLSQLVFYGNNGKNYEVRKVDGKPIDIAGANIPRRQKDNASTKIVDEQGNEVRIPADERIYNAVSQIFSNAKYYGPALSLTGILYKQGLSKNQAIAMTKALMEAHPNPKADIDDYIADVDNFLSTLPADKEDKPPVITYTLGSGIITEDIPPHPFLIPNWLPLEAATLMSGNGGLGKSYIALEIGIGIACGGVVLGSRVEPSRVVYLSAEDPLNTIKWRARQFLQSPAGQELDHSKLGNLKVIDWSVEKEKILYKLNSGGKNSAGFDVLTMERLREIVIEHDPVLVIVDNDSSLFGGSEIDRSQVNEYMMGMVEMQRLAAWLLLHHIDKSSARAGKDDAYSGSTAWNNSARARWSLGAEMLTVQKNNYGPKGYQAAVRFDDVHKCFVIGEPQPPISNFSRQREIEKAVIIALGGAADLRLRLSVKADQKKPVRTVLSELRGVSADQLDVQAAVDKLSQPPFSFLEVVYERCRVTDNKAKFVVLTADGVEHFNRLMNEASDD